ncbi:hypothetical protein [Micromonospora sp. KC213]|nr:hypothetical protein [Micromonospora sp. KC213]
MTPCPHCGAALRRWYAPAPGDPDDAEPHAECSSRDCDFSY